MIAPARHFLEACDHAERRCFPRNPTSREGADLAGLDDQAQIFDRMDRALAAPLIDLVDASKDEFGTSCGAVLGERRHQAKSALAVEQVNAVRFERDLDDGFRGRAAVNAGNEARNSRSPFERSKSTVRSFVGSPP